MCGLKALCSISLFSIILHAGKWSKDPRSRDPLFLHPSPDFCSILLLVDFPSLATLTICLSRKCHSHSYSSLSSHQGMHFQNFCACLLRVRLNRNRQGFTVYCTRGGESLGVHMMLKRSKSRSQMLIHTWRNISKNIFLTSHALCKPQVKHAWEKGVLIFPLTVLLNQDAELHKEHLSSHLWLGTLCFWQAQVFPSTSTQ